jgi:hypothetical protein
MYISLRKREDDAMSEELAAAMKRIGELTMENGVNSEWTPGSAADREDGKATFMETKWRGRLIASRPCAP